MRVKGQNQQSKEFWMRVINKFLGETIAPILLDKNGEGWYFFSFVENGVTSLICELSIFLTIQLRIKKQTQSTNQDMTLCPWFALIPPICLFWGNKSSKACLLSGHFDTLPSNEFQKRYSTTLSCRHFALDTQ